MAGRPRKPTQLKALTGTLQKCRINKNEPKPEPSLPSAPTHLDAGARAEWRRLAKELHSLGLLSNLDRATLASYCQNYSRWCQSEKELKRQGLVVTTPKGFDVPNPFISISNKAQENMRKMGMLLGLDPSSRGKISAIPPEPKKENPFEKFKRQGKKNG